MNLRLVPATENYFTFILELRNNPLVNKGFIERELISEKSHLEYMNQNASLFKVCLLDGLPVGYIGVIENDIRIAVHIDYLRKGIGTFMVSEIARQNSTLIAKVKIENIASVKLFEKLGFKRRYYLYEKG
jgi:ribosomal protein S18 acetylase RimI-like enzyme